jgi:hypothetical protein
MVSDVGQRPHWRDALILAVLTVVILGGLVHYGRGLGDDSGPSADGPPASPAPAHPTSQATAQLEGAATADPSAPPDPAGGTCWDGRETSRLKLCGLPAGARGLEWVFPSFAADRDRCHRAEPNDDSYPVVESYECFQEALGRPVTVTYDQVEDPQQVEDWLVARIGEEHMLEVPGPHGGRCVFVDEVNRPARITGMYERYPYAVSVYAETPRAAIRAWRTLVEQRSPAQVLGVRS